jgi:hypothetical protein
VPSTPGISGAAPEVNRRRALLDARAGQLVVEGSPSWCPEKCVGELTRRAGFDINYTPQ